MSRLVDPLLHAGRFLAWGLEAGSVVLLNAESGAGRSRLAGTPRITRLAWAPDGRLAVGRSDGTVAVHQMA